MVLNSPFVGRAYELSYLEKSLDTARKGHGSGIVISGEAGLGKTSLLDKFLTEFDIQNAMIGRAMADSAEPFLLFSDALKDRMDSSMFIEQEYVSFTKIFAINKSGLLMAQSQTEQDELDADIFAGMLSAVQNFVKDSLDRDRSSKSGLGRLEYGDMKIFIENGQHLFLAAVVRGVEHPEMRNILKQTLKDIEAEHGNILMNWGGRVSDILPVKEKVSQLAEKRFQVRRDLGGVSLKNERLRISNLILEFLQCLAEESPQIMILEDLHWADESSMFVLDYLSRNIVNKNILLISTMRPLENESINISINKMIEEGYLQNILLERLDNIALKQIIMNECGENSFGDEFTNKLLDSSDGNPFYLIELLRQMREEESIIVTDGICRLVNEKHAIPETVQDLVNKRIHSLEPDTLALSEYISCIGRIFQRDVALSIMTIREPEKSLKILADANIITLNNGTGEFSHAIFQDVIYNGIGNRWLAAYHRNIARYYEEAHRKNLDEVLYELARHYSATNEHDKAFNYLIMAGDKAANAFAPEQGLVFYEKAKAIHGKLKNPSSGMAKSLYLGIADMSSLLGEFDRALELYYKVLENENNKLIKSGIYRKLVNVHTWKSEYDKAWELSELGLGATNEADDYTRSQFFSAMGRICIRKGDVQGGQEYFEKCLELAKKLDDKAQMALSEMLIGVINAQKGDIDNALEHYMISLELEEELGSMPGIASLLNNIGLAYWSKGDLEKALEYHEKSLAIKQKIGDKYSIAGSLINIGLVNMGMGKLDSAMDYFRKSLDIKEKMGDKYGLSLIHCYMGMVLNHKGDFDCSLEHFNEVLELTESTKDKYQMADLFTHMGDLFNTFEKYDAAREYYQRAIDISEEINTEHIHTYAMLRMAENLIGEGKIDAASKILENEKEDENDIYYLIYGKFQVASGLAEKAENTFKIGIDKMQKKSKKIEMAFLHLEMGKLGYSDHMKIAISMFEEMGMKLWKERTSKLLNKL